LHGGSLVGAHIELDPRMGNRRCLLGFFACIEQW
jgi:hypothetical protein